MSVVEYLSKYSLTAITLKIMRAIIESALSEELFGLEDSNKRGTCCIRVGRKDKQEDTKLQIQQSGFHKQNPAYLVEVGLQP